MGLSLLSLENFVNKKLLKIGENESYLPQRFLRQNYCFYNSQLYLKPVFLEKDYRFCM